MKREIKFRGLSSNGQWFYGMPCKSNYGVELITEVYHVDGAEWNILGNDVMPETVGQFTGKQDRNGDDIYEGDIIEFDAKEWGDNETNIHLVEWNDSSAEWSWGGGCTSDMEWRKIIGNIYENSELL